MSAYPVKTWTRKSQEEFLARYPWTGKYFNWTAWPIWIIDRITKNNRMLARSYPHTIRLFIYRHWKWFTGLAAAILVSFGIGIASPNLRDMQLAHERIVTEKATARKQASMAKISENERLQAEADARKKDAEARKAKADEEKAKADAEKAKADAEKATADARIEEVRIAEMEAQKAKADEEKAKAEALKAESNKESIETVGGIVGLLAIIICIIVCKVSD